MTLVALSHAYPPAWNLGGEVALHRMLTAVGRPVTVLTRTPESYDFDDIHVEPIGLTDVLNVNVDPTPLIEQLKALGASAVIAQNELSLPAVKAAKHLGIPSVVIVHAPPRYGKALRTAVATATHVIFNTRTSMEEWGRRDGLVVHPPISPLPPASEPHGTTYTLLSNLANKGVAVVLDLAAQMPEQPFLIVRSPAEFTHGLPDFDERATALPNVTIAARVPPADVAARYLSRTRILLAPSRYETYGMSAIEAAGYSIPAVHVDTPHVREGIGDAAILIPPLNRPGTLAGIEQIEADYPAWSHLARARAEWLAARQVMEQHAWARFCGTL